MGQDKFGENISWPEIRLDRISPAQAGVDPGHVTGFLNQLEEKKVHLHSFMMLKGDRVFAEGEYAPCRKRDPHMLCSLSKSFTSTAVGFAVQEKRLSVEDFVADYFRDDPKLYGSIPEASKKMKIRHLLTMNTGHVNSKENVFKDMAAEWSTAFLTDPIEKEPGSWFHYSTLATYMLSFLVQKVTGETILQYLRPRLFEPLGFQHDIWWELSPEGVDSGGVGLYLPVEDIAKFGVFLQNKGVFQGKRLLNADWFEEATKPWSDSSNTWSGENCFGYGYQFWMCHVPGTFRGDGAFGQYCVILPEQDMIFATTGGQLDMQKILDAFWDHIFPHVGKVDERDPGLAERQKELEKHLAALQLPAFYREKGKLAETICIPENCREKEYRIDYNILQITGLKFAPDETGEGIWVELKNGEQWDRFHLSAASWEEGHLHVDGAYTQRNKWTFRTGLFEHFYARGCSEKNVLYFDMIYPRTAYQDTWEVVLGGDEISVQVKRNAGFDEIDFKVRGRAV